MKKNYANALKDGTFEDKLLDMLEKAPGHKEVDPLLNQCIDKYEADITPGWIKGNNETLNGEVATFTDLLVDLQLAAQRNAFNAGVEFGLKRARKTA